MEVLILSGKDIGSYKPNTKTAFTKEELKDVISHLHRFFSQELTAKHFCTTVSAILTIEKLYHETKGLFTRYGYNEKVLGHKEGSYCLEDDYLNRFKDYTWKSLSENEKQFYEKYKKLNDAKLN